MTYKSLNRICRTRNRNSAHAGGLIARSPDSHFSHARTDTRARAAAPAWVSPAASRAARISAGVGTRSVLVPVGVRNHGERSGAGIVTISGSLIEIGQHVAVVRRDEHHCTGRGARAERLLAHATFRGCHVGGAVGSGMAVADDERHFVLLAPAAPGPGRMRCIHESHTTPLGYVVKGVGKLFLRGLEPLSEFTSSEKP